MIDAHQYDGTEINDFTRYRIGFSDFVYDPGKETYKHMLHLIAYDVRNPRRLRKVAKVCEDFGVRVEYSVFECDLDEDDFSRLWEGLMNVIDEDEDSILAYRICGACVQRIQSMGDVVRPEKILIYIP